MTNSILRHRHSKVIHAPFIQLPICMAIAAIFSSPIALAAAIPLAQVPAGNGGREPSPNLIISVDDSGSMGSSGMASLRTALTNAFSTSAVADDTIRLGFQSMWHCRGFSASPFNAYGTCPDNRIQKFSGTHRTNFNNWVSSLTAYAGTPSHQMLKNVHSYMSSTSGVWSPFADNPGVSEGSSPMACRKTFHIFMTDGGWNSTQDNNTPPRTTLGLPGDADSTVQTLPDGKVYDPFSTTVMEGTRPLETQTRPYRDTVNAGDVYGTVPNVAISSTETSQVSSLSDWAFLMWATDYAPSLANNLNPIIRQSGDVDIGPTGSPYIIKEYWNPRNNPMSWQGITTYTIGFNASVMLPTTASRQQNHNNAQNPYVMVPGWDGSTWGADLTKMMRGDAVAAADPLVPVKRLQWANPLQGQSTTYGSLLWDSAPSKDFELWHMALNSRGKYTPATDGAALAAAFAEIVNQVIADSSTPISSIAANTQSASTSTKAFVAGYDAAKWRGFITARTLTSTLNLSSTALWNASTQLDLSTVTPTTRVILSHSGTNGISFEWGNLSTPQKDAIKGADSDTVGQERLAYLRGDRTKEESVGGNYRNRDSRLGDIVNSNIWVASRPLLSYTMNNYSTFKSDKKNRTEMLYVGANDGMLHGFSTSDGVERIAYVPKGVYNKLSAYTNPGYSSSHQYMVDGSPFTGDYFTGSEWKTALAGVLGGGGKGYFVLDVTDPSLFTAANASSLVIIDTTDTTDADIGHIFSDPVTDTSNSARTLQISKLNNGRWALIFGNGVNSANERPVLLIQYLDGDKSLQKITLAATTGTGNGLSAPQLIDIDGNGTIDVAYAGDLQGNFWKISLASATSGEWGSYYTESSAPAPLFIARDSSDARQPITSVAQWAVHPMGGLMLSFGTGREYTNADRTTTNTQSIYGIWDNMALAPSTTEKMTGGSIVSGGRASLVAQTRTGTTIGAYSQNYETTSNNAVTYTITSDTKRGWYFDIPNSGERVVSNGGMISSRLVYHRSRIPGSGSIATSGMETCTPSASAPVEYFSVFDILNGGNSKKAAFDNDGGGYTGTENTAITRWRSGTSDRLLLKTTPGKFVSIGAGGGGDPPEPPKIGPSAFVREAGWRPLQ
ncbi:MAG: pilus assembly protein [Rhodoferax sp.]